MTIKRARNAFIFFSSLLISIPAVAASLDLGLFPAASHKSAIVDVDKSILSEQREYTISCTLPPVEEETALQPFSSGSSHISIYVNGFKWPPFTRYEIEPNQEVTISFSHINRGNKVKVGIQNLDLINTLIFHCFAYDGALK